ncbi:hypothetical protein BJV77DRAFT_1069470 [Russula vinacea]|nr:hypothetical protein BJV77DRAFT_1069470 [Russula vinacea]
MRLSSYISFFFLLGMLILAAPVRLSNLILSCPTLYWSRWDRQAEPAGNLNPRVAGGGDVNWKRGQGVRAEDYAKSVEWKRALEDVGQPLL